jgi:zinc protease
MPGRFDEHYFEVDLLSDVLGRGQSSRLYQKLVKEKELFTSLSSFVMGSIDPGLLVISGRLKEGVELPRAEGEVNSVMDELLNQGIHEDELQKAKNQSETTFEFDEVEVMNRAMNLAFASLSGDVSRVNRERSMMDRVTVDDVTRAAKEILTEENSSVMYYKASQ